MNHKSIKPKLITLCTDIFKNSGVDTDLLEHVDFIDDLGMDSITFIALIVEIEECFEIVIPDDMLLPENFKCVDDIGSVIENELSKKSDEAEVINNV